MGKGQPGLSRQNIALIAFALAITALNVIYFSSHSRQHRSDDDTGGSYVPGSNTVHHATRRRMASNMRQKGLDEAGVSTTAVLQIAPRAVSDATLDESLLPEPVVLLHCNDFDTTCSNTSFAGGCQGEVLFHTCRRSCGMCPLLEYELGAASKMTVKQVETPLVCVDSSPASSCLSWAMQGLCATKVHAMLGGCKATCSMCSAAALVDESAQQGHSGSQAPAASAPGALASPEPCVDHADLCPHLGKSLGLCTSTALWWVPEVCPRTCGTCRGGKPQQLAFLRELVDPAACEDFLPQCRAWAEQGHCKPNTRTQSWMVARCRRSCNQCTTAGDKLGGSISQQLGSRQSASGASGALAQLNGSPGESSGTLAGEVVVVGRDAAGRPRVSLSDGQRFAAMDLAKAVGCKDKDSECPFWAKDGECQKNPVWMLLNCPLACNSCPGTIFVSYLPDPLAQVLLNNGVLMPTIGYGTAGLGDGTKSAVEEALRAGYRHLDSAQAREWYREDLTGAALEKSGVPRKDVFLTTKIHPRHFGFDATLEHFTKSLEELRTEHVDLVLLHYASCWGSLCGDDKPQGTWQDSWRALEQLYETKRARAIGVSNFGAAEMEQLLQIAKVKPQVLQVHIDPFAQDRPLLLLCRQRGVQLVAYSTLGTQWSGTGQNPVLTSPVLKAIGEEVGGRSPAQVALRWALQLGIIVLPRSANPQRMASNLQLFDFSLNSTHMQQIAALDGQVPK